MSESPVTLEAAIAAIKSVYEPADLERLVIIYEGETRTTSDGLVWFRVTTVEPCSGRYTAWSSVAADGSLLSEEEEPEDLD